MKNNYLLTKKVAEDLTIEFLDNFENEYKNQFMNDLKVDYVKRYELLKKYLNKN